MPRMALGLSYEGSGWNGWQTQPGGRTIQDALEAALESFLGQSTATICAGRTDSGVHALQQVVHLDTVAVRPEMSWIRGLNAHLPKQIAVQWARATHDEFHARFDARARTYFYILRSAPVPSPILRGRVGWVHDALDETRMHAAAGFLSGTHDFSAFRSSQCQAASPIRTLTRLDIQRFGAFLVLRFEANAFLHHMVRNLMGVLVAVGRGRYPPEWAAELLSHRDRRLAAPTFMPDGLYLAHVAYPDAALPLLLPEDALAAHFGWPQVWGA